MDSPYDLTRPDAVYHLDPVLNEISGICSLQGERLLCVHDEARDIFELEAGKIVNRYSSGKPGDSEDIVVVEQRAFMLEAEKRAIYEYADFRSSMKRPKKHKLKLKKSHDPEGMCYDRLNHRLMIACKGNPRKKSRKREIFGFDLKKRSLSKDPLFTIDARDLAPGGKRTRFNPSGIAIHPKSKDIYLIGTRGLKLLVRLDGSGRKLLGIQPLEAALFGQPEGIAFNAEGDLFIASERKGDADPRLFLFRTV